MLLALKIHFLVFVLLFFLFIFLNPDDKSSRNTVFLVTLAKDVVVKGSYGSSINDFNTLLNTT